MRKKLTKTMKLRNGSYTIIILAAMLLSACSEDTKASSMDSATLSRMLAGSIVIIVMLTITSVGLLAALTKARRTIRQLETQNEEECQPTADSSAPPTTEAKEAAIQEEQAKEQAEEQQHQSQQHQEMLALRSQGDIFIDQLKTAILQQMGNPNLTMEDLGETMGMSRVQLYRRVKNATGLPPVELLRQMRLQQGYTLVCTTNKTIQEIAYEVGFSTPAYFSKCFKQQYGKYPSELRT